MTDIAGDTSTTATITTTGTTASALETNLDQDWFRIDLAAGLTYDFALFGDGSATSLDTGTIRIRDSFGNILSSVGKNGVVDITATTTGTYFISVEDLQGDNAAEGNYIIRSRMDDLIVNNITTTSSITATGLTEGVLGQEGDSDWYRVTLTEGFSYSFALSGTGGTDSLDDGRIRILDASGVSLGSATSAALAYSALASGTYYIEVVDAGIGDDAAEGRFRVDTRFGDTVVRNTNTNITLAEGGRLTNAIDALGDSDWFRFNARDGFTYTFSLTGTGGAAALDDKRLTVRDADGDVIATSSVDGTVRVTVRADSTGPLFIDVQGAGSDQGRYQISAVSNVPTLTGTANADYLAGGSNATRISGLAGGDQLFGNGGRDRLDGGSGNDSLTGGADRDTFVFSRGDDRDRILDFRNNIDVIRLEDLGIGSVRAALAKADQVGRNVVFDFGQGDVLTVLGVTKAQLSDDLIFG